MRRIVKSWMAMYLYELICEHDETPDNLEYEMSKTDINASEEELKEAFDYWAGILEKAAEKTYDKYRNKLYQDGKQ